MTGKDWRGFDQLVNQRMTTIRHDLPGVMQAFGDIAAAAIGPGVLDTRTKELIALAIGIAVRCDGCLDFHAKAAARAGATREEVLETIGVAIYMGGGPSVIYGSEALEAFDALSG